MNFSDFFVDKKFIGTGDTFGIRAGQTLADAVDEFLHSEFEMYELEGIDESVFFNFSEESADIVTAEIRPTTDRERGGIGGPLFHLSIVSHGPTDDNVTTWYNVGDAVRYGEKCIARILGVTLAEE